MNFVLVHLYFDDNIFLMNMLFAWLVSSLPQQAFLMKEKALGLHLLG